MGHWVEIETPHGSISGWRAEASSPARGAIVVIQEIFGVNAHIRNVADDYAQQGYTTLAPAFFDVLEPGVELDYDQAGVAKGRDLTGRLGLEKASDIAEPQRGHSSITGRWERWATVGAAPSRCSPRCAWA